MLIGCYRGGAQLITARTNLCTRATTGVTGRWTNLFGEKVRLRAEVWLLFVYRVHIRQISSAATAMTSPWKPGVSPSRWVQSDAPAATEASRRVYTEIRRLWLERADREAKTEALV